VFGTTVKPAPFRIDRDVMPAKRVTMLPDAPFAGRMSFCNEGLFDNLEPKEATPSPSTRAEMRLSPSTDTARVRRCTWGASRKSVSNLSLLDWLIGIGKLDPALRTDADVEVTLRVGDGRRLIFV